MSSDKFDIAGRLLAEAWREARTIDSLPPDLRPRTVAEAAAVQDAMARYIGHPVVGWKVGGRPGPVVGRIFGPTLFVSPATLPAERFAAARIECEIGFRLLSDLPPRSAAYPRDEVAAQCRLVLTVEVTASRFTGGKHSAENDADLLAIVSDNAVQGGLVTGAEIEDWQHLRLLDIPVELRIDGGPVVPANPDRRAEPFETMTWLANELSARRIGMVAGQLVTTGSATQPQPLVRGSSAIVIYGDLGEIRVEVVA